MIDDPAGADAADLNVPDPQGWLAQRTAGPDHAARVISAAIAGGLPIRGPLPDRAWIAAHAEAAPDVPPPPSAPAAPTPAGPLGPEPPPAGRAAAPAAKPRSAPAPDRGLGWIADCQQTSSGDPVPNLANVALALRRDANLADLVAYDQMAGTVMLRRSVPARAVDGSPEPMPRPLRDADVVAVQEYLQLAGMARLAVATVHDAITLRAREAAYHPVQDYLTALPHCAAARRHAPHRRLADPLSRRGVQPLQRRDRAHVPGGDGSADHAPWLQMRLYDGP